MMLTPSGSSLLIAWVLVWAVWLNLSLQTSEDIERRRQRKPQTLGAMLYDIAPTTVQFFLIVPAGTCFCFYVVAKWLALLAACGEAELMVYYWWVFRLRQCLC